MRTEELNYVAQYIEDNPSAAQQLARGEGNLMSNRDERDTEIERLNGIISSIKRESVSREEFLKL